MRRGRVEIYVDVLRVIGDTHSPTWIMTLANVSWRPLTVEVLPRLVERGLVSESEPDGCDDKKKRHLYHLTSEGRRALALWGELERWLGV